MREMPPNLMDYDKTYREFKWEIPEYYNFGFDGIDRWAEDRTKLALISVDDTGIHAVRHTFYDLMWLSNQFANVLLKMGIKKGDRVLLMLPQDPGMVCGHDRDDQVRGHSHAHLCLGHTGGYQISDQSGRRRFGHHHVGACY